MTRSQSFSGLKWVSGELDEVIRKARDALEEYVEGGGETSVLGPGVAHLSQVRGVLEMLQLFGAARLAEEMQISARVLGDGAAAHPQDVAEALMLAMIQLPDYLEKLDSGVRDLPVLLLPSINDLRMSRGADPLSEADLVVAERVHAPEEPVVDDDAGRHLRRVAHRMRPQLHKGLLNWFRDTDTRGGQQTLRDVFQELEDDAFGAPLLKGVFRAAHAVMEGVLAGDIASGKDLKALIGRVDRIVKHVCDKGVETAASSVQQGVIKDLLLQVARTDSTQPAIVRLKADYHLDRAFPTEEELAEARRRQAAPGANALAGMQAAAVKELVPLKDTLDLYMRGGRDQVTQLLELQEPMRRLAKTMEMTGLDDLARRLNGRAKDLAAVEAGDVAPDDALLMRVAGDLLIVESALGHMLRVVPGEEPRQQATQVPDGEMQGLVNRTLDEAAVDMAKAKEAIVSFMDAPNNRRPLEGTPQLFHGVAGALRVIERPDAAGVLDRICDYVEQVLLRQSDVPEPRALDALADTIIGVEYYMEAVSDGRQDTGEILRIAESALARLDISGVHLDEAVETVQAERLQEPGRPGIAGEAGSESSEPEITPLAEVPVEAIDPEILEIFLEEAREEEPIIQDHFQRWREDAEDDAALSTVRRSFHTLKGSGRLAGALTIGDFSWGVESLLNRLIDQTLRPTPVVVDYVADAIAALPELIDAQEQQRVAKVDVPGFIRRAEELLQQPSAEADLEDSGLEMEGIHEDELELPSSLEFPQPVEEVGAEEGLSDGLVVEDSELRDIFQTESREHLLSLQDFLDACAEPPCGFDEELVRSLHTLAGSARMTGLEPIAVIAKALERKACVLQDANQGADARFTGLLAEGVVIMGGMVESLGSRPMPIPDSSDLLQRIADYSADAAMEPAEALSELEVSSLQLSEMEDIEGLTLPGADLESDVLREIAESKVEPGAEIIELESLDLREVPELDTASAPSLEEGLHLELAEDEEPSALELLGVEDDSADLAVLDEELIESSDNVEYETLTVDPELQEIFLEEADELLVGVRTGMDEWGSSLGAQGAQDLRRAFHTLKGGARMAGIESVGDLSHALERFANDAGVAPGKAGLVTARQAVVQLEQQLEAVRQGGPVPFARDLVAQLETGGEPAAPVEPEEIAVAEGLDLPEAPIELEPAGEVFPDEEPELESSIEIEGLEIAPEVLAEALQPSESLRPAVDIEEPPSVPVPEIGGPEIPAPEKLDAPLVPPVAPEPPLVSAEESLEAIGGDRELLEIFLEEAEDLRDQLDERLRDWERDPEEADVPVQIKRTLHTLKGSSRLAGIESIGDLSHALETLLEGITPELLRAHASLMPLAQRAADYLASQIESVRAGGPVQRAAGLISELEYIHEELASPGEAAEASATPKPMVEQPAAAPLAAPMVQAAPAQEQVRVRADVLNRLVNNAGEISIYRARLEQQNLALGFNLGELEQTVTRLQDQLRQMEMETEAQILYRYEQEEGLELETEFDPLELDRFSTIQQVSRSLIETVNDLVSIKNLLSEQQGESETLLLQQARISNDLQDGLLRTRMVPFTQLVPRLHRLVRQTAGALGKRAVLEVIGGEGEMDRSILDRMLAPMEHILRNAISHGIEMPETRRAQGKNEVGRITIYLSREGNDVIITVSDDGAGLNLEAIRRKAVESGLLGADAQLEDDDVMQLVLEPGFSTVKEVTQISGRGVGTDVVVSEVKQMGGSLEIESQPGRGTGFSIRLPFTLAISEALLVDLGDDVFAVPHPTIEGVVRISSEELTRCYAGEQSSFRYAGHDYQVRYLGSLLSTAARQTPEGRKWLPLMLVRSGEHRVAIQVDHILGNRQIVVKSVGAQLSTVRWISGGTILADGRVALILDVSALVRMDIVQSQPAQQAVIQVQADEHPVKVMVVDDSITVRKVTSRLLKRHNMDVMTAKDGVDALATLQEQQPDVMLLDIEMPRMDGYELARHMRNSEELQHIPIIMITSRSGEKHRNMALSLGVKRYLGKPYQESDLLDNIYGVLAEAEVEA